MHQRLGWGAAGFAAVLALGAGAEPRDRGPLADVLPAPVAAASLPRIDAPGIRAPAARTSIVRQTARYGERLVERLPASDAGTDGTLPLEVEYTIDPVLETSIRQILADAKLGLAHVVVMDPESGDLYAYVSTDAERFPATRPYPTASLMKVVTAAAVLRDAPAAAERLCRSFGSPYWLLASHLDGKGARRAAPTALPPVATASGGGGHDATSPAPHAHVESEPPTEWVGGFRDALAISNNQCFARYAVHDLGAETLVREIRNAGLLEAPAPGHASGTLAEITTPLDLGNLGSGLAGSEITPLAAARLAALLAEGRLVPPRWTGELRDARGVPVRVTGLPEARRAWSPETAGALREALREVTETGTARRAFHRADASPRLGPVAVAGKTGTLRGEDPAGLYQWFIGVAPAEEPEIAIAVLVLHPEPDQRERGERAHQGDHAERVGDAPRTSASDVAAETLARLFCDADGDCSPARVGALRARARAREAEGIQHVSDAIGAALEAAHEASTELDAPPKPVGVASLKLPRRLLRRKAEGDVVLLVELSPEGRVLGVTIESTTLPPAYGDYFRDEVRTWAFTPPRRSGRPVGTTARFPIRVE